MTRHQPASPKSDAPGGAKEKLDHKVDEEVEDSFPASDPPSYASGKHRAGAPQKTQSAARKAKG
jgi:hypothetical protein